MKKILPIIIILLLLGVGGYFYLTSRGQMPNVSVGTGNKTGGNVFTSIKDALSKSLSLKCIYKDDDGKETTTYIKAGAVRVMMTVDAKDSEQPGNILMKDKKMYMWSDVTKKGFIYNIEEPKNITPFPTSENMQGSDENSGANQEESVLESIEKFKDACKAETIADSMFVVPTDVEFQDMNALQEQMKKALPTTTTQEDGTNTEDFQKYLQDAMKQQDAGQ